VLKTHSLPLQALAERLDHFDRVADVALGDLYNYDVGCWKLQGNHLFIYSFFCSKLLFYVVLFIHLLRCMLDHQSANGLLAAPTSMGAEPDLGLTGEIHMGSTYGIFTYMCLIFPVNVGKFAMYGS